MRLSIVVREAGAPLHIEVMGTCIGISDAMSGTPVEISDDGGALRIRIGAQPAAETQQQAEAPQVAESAAELCEVTPEQMFIRLSSLRKQVAAEAGLPPYVVFHDDTLKEMARLLPADLQALRAIKGVGEAKLAKYGSRFLAAIHGKEAV